MKLIRNPILRGFNPDPSIIRVGQDYYIATSTFEWFPGVQIHHSRDMINWRLAGRPLNRVSQLDMRGIQDSLGVWAPCLSFDNGVFYLIYTIVRGVAGKYMDCHNYLVTADDICGEWSEPIFLNSSGFDPSLFHDNDGKKWLVNVSCDNTREKGWFGGIILQEYWNSEQKLIGPTVKIFDGTALGCTEGPHLYYRNGYYYLITAEGGTGLNHAVTMCRSKNITGPYEVDPQNPILTSRYDPTNPLQKAGHADFVETDDGQVYMVHLCGRPIPQRSNCILGRETCIQKMKWTGDLWLRLDEGGNVPKEYVPAPDIAEHPWEEPPCRDDFDSGRLDINFQTLRIPLGEDMLSLTERPGFLRLKGRESLNSRFEQSLIARRQQSFCYTARICVEFEPDSHKQMAGLVCYYNTENYHYLRISHDDKLGKCLGIVTCENYNIRFPMEKDISIEGWSRCHLKAEIKYDILRFYYSRDGREWMPVGGVLDAHILSDEHCKSWWGFTGAFVGLCCQDLSGRRRHADFDYFEYREMA